MAVECHDQVGFVSVEHFGHDRCVRRRKLQGYGRIPAVEIYIVGIDHFLTEGIRRNDMDISAGFIFHFQIVPEFISQGTDLVSIGKQLMAAPCECDGMVDSFK